MTFDYSTVMMHYTKFFILLTVLLCLSFLMGCGTAESLKNNKPNVVIIFLDDSGWSDFEPFGQKRIKTPNVNRLAQEGVVYQNFMYHRPFALLLGQPY